MSLYEVFALVALVAAGVVPVVALSPAVPAGLTLLGWLVWPLIFGLFRPLRDAGFFFSHNLAAIARLTLPVTANAASVKS